MVLSTPADLVDAVCADVVVSQNLGLEVIDPNRTNDALVAKHAMQAMTPLRSRGPIEARTGPIQTPATVRIAEAVARI
jgi:hypothetical protein